MFTLTLLQTISVTNNMRKPVVVMML